LLLHDFSEEHRFNRAAELFVESHFNPDVKKEHAMKLRVALVLMISISELKAQTANAVLVPSQLATAKTAFVGYGGASTSLPAPVVQSSYPDVQRALVASNRYTLTAKPADAELSLRVSLEDNWALRLAVFDTKTGMLLWTIDEPIVGAARKETQIKNVNDAAIKVVSDLTELSNGQPSTSTALPSPTKTRFSQDK
jgi:hypothetical protein